MADPTPSSSPPRPSALTRVPNEIWQLILYFTLHVPSPPGYLLHPPSSPSPHPISFAPFRPPSMHWTGLRSPITTAYSDKLAAAQTRRTLRHVSRGFRDLLGLRPIYATRAEWVVLPMEMDARRAIIWLASELPAGKGSGSALGSGHMGGLVKRLDLLPSVTKAHSYLSPAQAAWASPAPDIALLRRILRHCTSLEELYTVSVFPGIVPAVLASCAPSLRSFVYVGSGRTWRRSGGCLTPGEAFALLANCPRLELLSVEDLEQVWDPPNPNADANGPTAPTRPAVYLFPPVPPLALSTLSLPLTRSTDPFLAWLAGVRMPAFARLKITSGRRPGEERDPGDFRNLGEEVLLPGFQWDPFDAVAFTRPSTAGPPPGPAPATPRTLPPGLRAFLAAHGAQIRSLDCSSYSGDDAEDRERDPERDDDMLAADQPLPPSPSELGWSVVCAGWMPGLEEFVGDLRGGWGGVMGYGDGVGYGHGHGHEHGQSHLHTQQHKEEHSRRLAHPHPSLRRIALHSFFLSLSLLSPSTTTPSHPSRPQPHLQARHPQAADTPDQPQPRVHVRAHLEHVLDVVIACIGGDFPALEVLRIADLQRQVVPVPVPVPARAGEAPGGQARRDAGEQRSNEPTSSFAAAQALALATATTTAAAAAIAAEYTAALRCVGRLCAANGVRLEDCTGGEVGLGVVEGEWGAWGG